MKEGTYDKKYIATHTVVTTSLKLTSWEGRRDCQDAEWAAKKCGVPEWTIKALARQWASKATTIAHNYGGSYIRGAFSTEPARLEVLNLAMQGIGKRELTRCVCWRGIAYTGRERDC